MDLLESKKLSISTLENIHTLLHPTFTLAVRDDIIRKNPSDGVMADIKKKKFGKKAYVRHALTIEQQKAFLRFVQSNDVYRRWKNLFITLFGTGCRIGEIVGLRWDDCDFRKKCISINHSVTYYPRERGVYQCEYEVSLPKTEAGIRMIPMLPEVYEALMDELEFQKSTGMHNVKIIDGMSNFIFFNRFYSVHNPSGVNRAIRRISEDYNVEEVLKAKKEKREPIIIPRFSCHHIRHTFCTRLCENETNVKLIQEIMGHKDIQTTLDIYAEITESKKIETFASLANNLNVF